VRLGCKGILSISRHAGRARSRTRSSLLSSGIVERPIRRAGTDRPERAEWPGSGCSGTRPRSPRPIGGGRDETLVAGAVAGLLWCCAIALPAACSRGYYRESADQEVAELVAEKSTDPRWSLRDFTIDMDPAAGTSIG